MSFEIENGVLKKYKGTDTEVVIPEGVTAFGAQAFWYCEGLTSIVIPDSVTEIGEQAFSYCRSLTSIAIPDSVTKIGGQAFSDCSSLTSIAIPDSVTKIGQKAFAETAWYQEQPDGLVYAGRMAYKYKGDILENTQIDLLSGTNGIAEGAFFGCKNLNSITIPDSVTEIGWYAFSGCSSLTSITIPDSVTEIGREVFSGCSSLTSVTIPDSVTQIGGRVFSDCSSLTSVTIPDSVAEIGWNTFSGCSSLTSITIPDSVTKIGEQAFSGCSSLTSITIPDSVTEIGEYAFHDCRLLKDIRVDDENVNYTSFEGILFNKDKTKLIACPNGKTGSVAIPDGVTHIENGVFYDCASLKTLEFPNTLLSIGTAGNYNMSRIYGVFENCTALESVSLPQSLTIIGDRCFMNSGLSNYELPPSLLEVGAYAFFGTHAETITIPKTVKKVGLSAFAGVPEIIIYDSIDPNAKECKAFTDDFNGEPNSSVGFLGIFQRINYTKGACNSVWHDHMLVVKSAETEQVRYKVWMGATEESRKYYCTLASSWGKNASFNFEKSDALFSEMKQLTNKATVAITRLSYPHELSDNMRDTYSAYLKRMRNKALECFIREDNLTAVRYFIENKLVDVKNILNLIDIANTEKNTECLALLMDFKNRNFTQKQVEKNEDKKIERELNAAPKDWIFTNIDANTCRVTTYNGAESEVVIPSEYDGKLVSEISPTIRKRGSFEKITKLVVPDSVKEIGNNTFNECSELASVILSVGVAEIGSKAFRGCESLTSITIPEGIKSIGSEAFRDCESLTSITIPEGVEEIADEAFRGCSALKSFTISGSMRTSYRSGTIGYNAFKGCKAIKSITVKSKNISLAGHVFPSSVIIRAPKGSQAEAFVNEYNATHKKRYIFEEIAE